MKRRAYRSLNKHVVQAYYRGYDVVHTNEQLQTRSANTCAHTAVPIYWCFGKLTPAIRLVKRHAPGSIYSRLP